MILGIGIDLCEIKRIETSLARFGSRFLQKVLSAQERDWAQGKPAAYLAKRWAAKEALAKALGTGIGARCALTEIEILPGPAGRPLMRLSGQARQTVQDMLPVGHEHVIHLSLTDEAGMAQAMVVIEARIHAA